MITSKFIMCENIGHFLTHQGLGLFDKWIGTMSAEDQRFYFGVYLGRGTITVNGLNNTITRTVKVGYGAWFFDVSFIDGNNLSNSYFDVLRGHNPTEEFKIFLNNVGGKFTCHQGEYEIMNYFFRGCVGIGRHD